MRHVVAGFSAVFMAGVLPAFVPADAAARAAEEVATADILQHRDAERR
jgi:hypothetical protein